MKHAIAIALGSLSISVAHGAGIAGYVLVVDGRWAAQGDATALVVGSPVVAGARLRAKAPVSGDRIVVVEAKSGAVLAARRCDEPRACSSPLVVPALAGNATGTSSLGQLLDRVVTRIAGDPDRYVATISRGPEILSDAILAWSPDSVDLSPALTRLPEGDYELRLVPSGCEMSHDCAPPPVALSWAKSGPAPYALHGLGAGVYTLVVTSRRATPAAHSRRSWVLLVPEAERASAQTRYDAGVQLVASWGSAVDGEVKKGFLRALLLEL